MKDAQMKQLVYQAMHDLRNPVNSISMNAELVKMLLAEGVALERVAYLIDAIITQCATFSAAADALETTIGTERLATQPTAN